MNETMKKLIKLSNTHYIIVDDSEIKEDLFFDFETKSIRKGNDDSDGYKDYSAIFKKITYSTESLEEIIVYVPPENYPTTDKVFNKINQLSLSEVEEAVYGYNVEKMADDWWKNNSKNKDYALWEQRNGFIKGFKDCQELTKDKLFTIDDMKEFGLWLGNNLKQLKNKIIDEIFDDSPFKPKTEWDIEFINGKITLL